MAECYPSDKVIFDKSKIERYLLYPPAKHSNEFFDVGYTQNNCELLFKDIEVQFDINNATEYRHGNGFEKFVIYMMLGITKKRPFATVWQVENGNRPRFITAYRIRIGGISCSTNTMK